MLNEAQKDLYNALIFEHAQRLIILKARQLGFSTAICGFFYHDTIMNPGTVSVIIGYNREMTAELLEKVKLFYKTTPAELRPTIQYDSRYEMSFPRINSKIIVLPSTETVGRGYTINNLLCTELAMWDKAEEKMSTLEASVPINGRIIVESTPNGIGNLYHEMWVSDNDYVKKEYGWWWGYTEVEIETIRRRTNNPQKFAQEYGLEFLTSGRLVFDHDAILGQRKNILKLGDEIKWQDEAGNDVYGQVHVKDELRIYKPPMKDHMYVAGADTSEGVEGGDFASVTFYDRRTGEEVAFFRGLIAPDKLGEMLGGVLAHKDDAGNDIPFKSGWGQYYNNAMLVVEINNHGITTIDTLKRNRYPNMYFRPAKFDTLSQEISEKMGWRTTGMTKPFLIDDFNKALRDNVLTIHSKETLDEMLTYVYNANNEMEPMTKKYHDDCIMGAGVGYQGFKILYDKPLDQIKSEEYLPVSGGY